jgi:predicted naringenin-chalcone synthase
LIGEVVALGIIGMGTAVPPHSISQSDAADVARIICTREPEQANVLSAMYRQTGVERRHMVFAEEVLKDVQTAETGSGCPFLPELCKSEHGPSTGVRMEHYRQQALPLALQASERALAESRSDPKSIGHVVTVCCTGFSAPGVDLGLIKHLNLREDVHRSNLGFMGCHGAINGLRVAQAVAETSPDASVLLCCVELCSIHYHYGWDPKKLVANSLFADGAAAVVGAAVDSRSGMPCVTTTGSCVFPDSEYAMTWNVGDHGFEMTLSTRVPALIARHLGPWLETWLSKSGLRIVDVKSWAVHPGGPRILTAVEDALGLDSHALETSREILADHGNMSSPTILFILKRICRRPSWSPCVALAFGFGICLR